MSPVDKITKSLGEALFPKIKRQLLSLFFLNPSKSFYYREVIKLLESTPGSVQKELKNLVDAEILTTEFSGNRRYYQVNQNCFIYHDLREIVVKTFGVSDLIKATLEPIKDKINCAFVFGSVAQQTDTGSSDIDLLFIADDISFGELAVILKPLEAIFQRELNFVVFPTSMLINNKFKDHHFLSSVFNKKVIPIIISDKNPKISNILSQIKLN